MPGMQPVCKMNWLYLLQILMTEMREEQLLQAAGIKPTAARILIIRNLDAADHPLSMAEIGDALETVDKSVISRTLALFRSARLIHIIQDGSDSVRYELCRCHYSVSGDDTGDDTGDDSDRHIHFHCEACGKTFCFRDMPVPKPALPDGFLASSVNYVINGLCPSCAGSKTRIQQRQSQRDSIIRRR